MNRLVELQRRDRSRRAALPWTDARIAHLKARWSQGVTAQRIARELGGGISRSAVLGKIHRLGFAELSPRVWVHRSLLKRAGERRISHQLWAALGRTFAGQHWLPPAWVIEAKPYVDDPRVDTDIPLAQRRSLLDLTAGACRWPVGDPSHPDFFFCGAEALRGEPTPA
ncbi:MAG: GcrA cell cycle regulator [Alphaproteobacteria bacterium]|nr:GcrA cell cycle regulator [Alphaproteobacteria bacterium]